MSEVRVRATYVCQNQSSNFPIFGVYRIIHNNNNSVMDIYDENLRQSF